MQDVEAVGEIAVAPEITRISKQTEEYDQCAEPQRLEQCDRHESVQHGQAPGGRSRERQGVAARPP